MLSTLDIVVIVAYLLALLWMGYKVSKRVNSADDLFTASNEVPWWMSGISAYMTMFSSGTFVI
jgi:Na+/proline symporter